MGGLGAVTIELSAAAPNWRPRWSAVPPTRSPLCLASQYAGWRLSQEGPEKILRARFGAGRALARREPLFEKLNYADTADHATLVLESAAPPPAAIVAKVAQDCGVEPGRLTFIYAPTKAWPAACRSWPVRSRSRCTRRSSSAFRWIILSMASAPRRCVRRIRTFIIAMGRTNDAIIYAGQVHLFVTGPATEARSLAERLPSGGSRDYGRPFAEIFKRVKGDFYAIRSDVVQPGLGDRHGDRERREASAPAR